MTLDEYRKKRNFAATPEPSGDGSPANKESAKLIYVIQKHRATQLHYDFRLEWADTLLSWAVPKGPSLDPSTKRLAMQVEDHPIEYADFEGIIPENEYGGGTVMVWDTGTWEPEVPNVDEALRKGDLKFTLHGKKLQGSWALVRTAGWGGNRRQALVVADQASRPVRIRRGHHRREALLRDFAAPVGRYRTRQRRRCGAGCHRRSTARKGAHSRHHAQNNRQEERG